MDDAVKACKKRRQQEAKKVRAEIRHCFWTWPWGHVWNYGTNEAEHLRWHKWCECCPARVSAVSD